MAIQNNAQRIAEDTTAQRLLNLFFIFNTATRPLSTEEVVSDSDIGYGSVYGTPQRESDLRKFRRDRQKLAEQGVFIVETRPPLGAPETEERFWKLDREHTFAAGGIITPDDAEVLAEAIDEYLSHTVTPLAHPLRSVRVKALEVAGRTNKNQANSCNEDIRPSSAPSAHTRDRGVHAASTEQNPDHGSPQAAKDVVSQALLDAIWNAFVTRQKLTFSYTNAHGVSSKRTVAIYGIFTHDGKTYITGLDDATASIRTFRVDRINRAWRPRGTYSIPSDFDINERVFMPFDFSEGTPCVATFVLPPATPESSVQTITRNRGSYERAANGSYIWTVTIHDVDAAASFALEHAREGLRPQAPQELIEAWNRAITQAVNAHGA